jgi:23S rRNA-/tRNA-specific pseudouridylate synthase
MVELQTLYKSEEYWVLNKPVRRHFDELMTHGDNEIWEPVHRLDFETSGALLFARIAEAPKIRELFKRGSQKIQKLYLAGASKELGPSFNQGREVEGFVASRYRHSKNVRFVMGREKPKGWRSLVQAKHLVRRVDESYRDFVPGFAGTLYEVELLTGARHQIRSFFASQDATLVGDPLYGSAGARLELHAWQLHFEDPKAPGQWIHVKAPLLKSC